MSASISRALRPESTQGEYYAKADRGRMLKASNGRMATCEDYNGWRWHA
jgi:hypothetical protein